MKENVKLEKDFTQVCVWSGCIVKTSDRGSIESFISFFKEKGVRIQYLEEIKTGPDIVNDKPVPETGGRNDLFFAVHKDDVGKFAIPRLQMGIRWIEDVVAKCNYNSAIYPERVFKYTSWNEENLANTNSKTVDDEN